MKAKNLKAVSKELIPAGPKPLADAELGTVAGGCGYEEKRRHRRTTRRTTTGLIRRGLVD
jgi:hypothetical protein